MNVAEAVLTIVLAVVFAQVLDMGIAGILFGVLVANIVTSTWYAPYLLWKNVFNEKDSHEKTSK
jgi:Na+-driven multidrug efflux pump